jgi:hypothetical protein
VGLLFIDRGGGSRWRRGSREEWMIVVRIDVRQARTMVVQVERQCGCVDVQVVWVVHMSGRATAQGDRVRRQFLLDGDDPVTDTALMARRAVMKMMVRRRRRGEQQPVVVDADAAAGTKRTRHLSGRGLHHDGVVGTEDGKWRGGESEA